MPAPIKPTTTKETGTEVLPFETIKLSFEMWGMEEMRRMFIELNTRLNALTAPFGNLKRIS